MLDGGGSGCNATGRMYDVSKLIQEDGRAGKEQGLNWTESISRCNRWAEIARKVGPGPSALAMEWKE